MPHPILHNSQKKIVSSRARFKVIRAGRKSGKTTVEQEIMLYKAVAKEIDLCLKTARNSKNRNVLFIAPTQVQARKIIWEGLKSRIGKVGEASEQRLEMKLPTADGGFSTIYVGGWENRENYRGMTDVVHITFDETDSMKDFFIGWQEIFRPMLLDTGGTADFIGTPKKENPNLKRLEKEFGANGENFESFHFPTSANPHIDKAEIDAAKRDMDATTYRQEIEAEYVDNTGSLFKYDAIIDTFSNTIVKSGGKFLIVDVADDGNDLWIFSFWEGLEEYRREEFKGMSSEMGIQKIREYCSTEHIPMSHVAVDAIGVGSSVASSSLLEGIIAYKSSFAPIKTDDNIVLLPNLGYRKNAPLTSDYANLRSQCVFTLADKVNKHEIASKVVGRQKEVIIEELSQYQDASKGDGKRMATQKDDVKSAIGRSPDASDTWIMRMYFVIREKIIPDSSQEYIRGVQLQQSQFSANRKNQVMNNTK